VTSKFKLTLDEVLPLPAERVAPGMPVTIALKGRVPLVVATLMGRGAGAGDPIS
jgi:hypothetical protein